MFEQLGQKHHDLHFDLKMDCSQLLPWIIDIYYFLSMANLVY